MKFVFIWTASIVVTEEHLKGDSKETYIHLKIWYWKSLNIRIRLIQYKM